MSTHLFFNVVTTYVSAQFVMISSFINACKIKYFLTTPSITFWLHTSVHHRPTFSVHGDVSLNLETGGNLQFVQ